MHNNRYAIITPYYKEPRSILERCILSVRKQTVLADHFLIADGLPQSWIDAGAVRHFKLDRSHGDYGNTPRGVGALIAIGEEYDGIGFLDADNWLEPRHVEACIEAASLAALPCDYVVAKRTMRRPDESIMPLPEEPDHVDTNCFFFLQGAFTVIPYWASLPKRLSPSSDRFFNRMIEQTQLRKVHVDVPTVNYLCMWETFYRDLGEMPPADAKPSIDNKDLLLWLQSLKGRELEVAERLAGFSLSPWNDSRAADVETTARSAPCPCGSGRPFKHCHEAR